MDKKDNVGPSMSQFGLSNQAFSIKSNKGDTLQLTISNQFPLKYFNAQGGGVKMVKQGDELNVGNGDDIRFQKGAPYDTMRFILPGWEPPKDPHQKGVKAGGAAKINSLVDEAQRRQICKHGWSRHRGLQKKIVSSSMVS